MKDTFEATLNNPLTEEQWDMITDVDFDRTDHITFHTKHGKEVEFTKVKHGKWMGTVCTACGESTSNYYDCDYCPHCGARMDKE